MESKNAIHPKENGTATLGNEQKKKIHEKCKERF